MTKKARRRPGPPIPPPYLVALRFRRREIAEEIKLIRGRLAVLECEDQTIQQTLGA